MSKKQRKLQRELEKQKIKKEIEYNKSTKRKKKIKSNFNSFKKKVVGLSIIGSIIFILGLYLMQEEFIQGDEWYASAVIGVSLIVDVALMLFYVILGLFLIVITFFMVKSLLNKGNNSIFAFETYTVGSKIIAILLTVFIGISGGFLIYWGVGFIIATYFI